MTPAPAPDSPAAPGPEAPQVTPVAGDRCPRCGGRFVCGMSAPGPCACTTVKLTASMLTDINRRWQHCLCLACLQALAAGEPLARPG